MALARSLREGVLRHARFGPAAAVAAACVAPAALLAGAGAGAAAAGPSSGLLARAVRAFAASTYLDKDQVTQRVLGVVKNFDKVDPAKVTPAASFAADLGLDSLDAVELVMALEEEFGVEIPDAEADKILSTGEAISYLAAHPQAK